MARVYIRADQDVIGEVARECAMTPGKLWDQCLGHAYGNMSGVSRERVLEIMTETYGPRPSE